jgi:choline dehydrogenase-like flavoprotein
MPVLTVLLLLSQNGPSQTGVGFAQLTVRDGVRESTASAFLHPARKRKNLTGVICWSRSLRQRALKPLVSTSDDRRARHKDFDARRDGHSQ